MTPNPHELLALVLKENEELKLKLKEALGETK